jgi:DNA polymerase-1
VLGIPFEQVTADHRRVAKMVNFGVLYGMSDYGLAERTGLASADASGFIDRYFQRFGTVKAFQDNIIHNAEDTGYAETMLGRRRYVPEIHSRIYGVRQAALRQIINAPIQGSASDIVKKAMIAVHAFLNANAPSVRMLLQVHDELLFEGPDDELIRVAPDIIRIMVNAVVDMKALLRVDLKMGANWEDMQPLKVQVPAVAASAH